MGGYILTTSKVKYRNHRYVSRGKLWRSNSSSFNRNFSKCVNTFFDMATKFARANAGKKHLRSIVALVGSVSEKSDGVPLKSAKSL
jgi:hypothetical protein